MRKFDVVIIGAGPGGMDAALEASARGLKTALIEKNTVGGTCLNVGCIPTKALLASSRLVARASHASAHGILLREWAIDYKKMVARKDEVVERIRASARSGLERSGVTWIQGSARFKSTTQIEVTGPSPEVLEAKTILIAAGSYPGALPGMAFDGKTVLSSTDILQFTELPKNILIVGGGAIGVEFASIFHALGTRVTLVELVERIVPLEDPDISTRLETILKRQGIQVFTGTKIEGLNVQAGGVALALAGETCRFEKVLVAVGRKPATEGLGLEAIGIRKDDRGYIEVNECLETSAANVYAIGDVIRSPQLAHVASYEGAVVIENLVSAQKRKVDYRIIPNCIYSDPEVASIGHTQNECRGDSPSRPYDQKASPLNGSPLISVKVPFAGNAKSQAEGESDGFFKLAATADGRISGACAIGSHVTELIAQVAIAMRGNLTVRDLAETVYAHPTASEAVNAAARLLVCK